MPFFTHTLRHHVRTIECRPDTTRPLHQDEDEGEVSVDSNVVLVDHPSFFFFFALVDSRDFNRVEKDETQETSSNRLVDLVEMVYVLRVFVRHLSNLLPGNP